MRKCVLPAAFVAALLFMVPGVAAAGASCPSVSRVTAEQVLRLHSELMVIGLTCQKYYRVPADIYGEYQVFTNTNADLLREAEDSLVASMGAKQFHALRTKIANDASQRAALMSPMEYCRASVPFVGEVLALNREGVRQYVGRLAEGVIQKTPSCLASSGRMAVASRND